MLRQHNWNKYEISLLIHAYQTIINKRGTKEDVLRNLSQDLRNMATNNGLEIDDKFRNLNGMLWQFAMIEKTFQNDSLGSHKPPYLFIEMVEMYNKDRPQYDKYLKKAISMVQHEQKSKIQFSEINMDDLRNRFVEWLHSQQKLKVPANVIVSTMTECSEYAMRHSVSKVDLWSISDPVIYNNVAKKLIGMRLFRVTHRKTAQQFDKVFIYYRLFLEMQRKTSDVDSPLSGIKELVMPFSEHKAFFKETFDEKEHLTEFSNWLESKGMSAASCRAYASNLRSLLVYCKNHNIIDTNFLCASNDDLTLIATMIFSNEEFINYNSEQHNRFSAAIKKYLEFRLGVVVIPRIIHQTSKKKNNTTEHRYQKAVISILEKHYSFGYRIESSIEMNRFRKYADIDEIVLPKSDDELKCEILNAGFLIGDKVYIIREDTVLELKNIFENNIVENNAEVVFFETIMTCYASAMEEHHITSDEMLREIVIENVEQIFEKYENTYIAKNFASILGKCNEREAVTKEMKRVWGATQTMQIAVLAEALPCIPERYIAQYLSANRNFVWASEGVYMSVDKLIITKEESDVVYNFVLDLCNKQGYVPLSDIPLGNMVEENYELSIFSLLNAVYNKVLYDDFYLNGKILTKDNNGLNIVTLAKQYIDGKDTCTFTEVNEKVSELSGASYRYMTYEALYNTVVRINEEHYVADKHVKFDVDTIDEILSKMIGDDFVAIKEITTFAVFPMCGQTWNHYLLESYCYRFSKKFKLKILGFNDKNAGMIITKGLTADYNELLARAAARSKIELFPENVGTFFFENGYMGKRKFSDLESVTERAKEIREG